MTDAYRVGDVVIDFRKYYAERDGEEIRFTALEWRLLRYLLEHRGETVTRAQLLTDVWGLSSTSRTRAIDIAIHKLRQKIEEDVKRPAYLLTIYGKGYQLVADGPEDTTDHFWG